MNFSKGRAALNGPKYFKNLNQNTLNYNRAGNKKTAYGLKSSVEEQKKLKCKICLGHFLSF